MNFLKWLASAIEESPGIISSKRVFAIVCLTEAVVKSSTGGDFASVSLWLGASTGLLLGQAITKT